MTRISRIVNESVIYIDEIKEWIDIGSGNGQVVKALHWEPFVKDKFYVEATDVENCLGPAWTRIDEVPPSTNADLITMFDVIEHFEKQEGLEFLKFINEHSKHSIIFTPEGFFPQEGTPDNPHMLHKSGWEAEELENLGYNVLTLFEFHYHSDLGRPFNALLAWR